MAFCLTEAKFGHIFNHMVEYILDFNAIFRALSDDKRRDMLSRLLSGAKTISELASHYSLTFAGVAKHLEVLSTARLIVKTRQGREQVITPNSQALRQTMELLQSYESLWVDRFDRLDVLLSHDPETPERQGE